MNAGALYKVARGDDDPVPVPAGMGPLDGRGQIGSVALWVFMGVVTSLFSLFVVAYGLRMDSPDWVPLALPWQVWLSTALLAAGGMAMTRSARQAAGGHRAMATRSLIAGGMAALAFVVSQGWAWASLADAAVVPAAHPSASFFYLLTGMHALHVLGGLVVWGVAWRALARWHLPPAALALRIRLLARYWHFMLAVWLVLLAALGWLTPEIVRAICGTAA
ncbi:cytochrome c oxidase subunit 3 [Cupriavidus gilardii J11]|uniref:Cytochrome c oxidase subunit 3 n=1 Tax=Cupriavidus gilardii J11 TaxID=936133 RepID=A0A562B7D0_9BURK|nr:cytochrome c oxidase subunit 3 [Cupriavidus gilardii]TWG81087.1 cytochrome c oxidase subunit 3 [Cupriavidus gilardii J11]